MRGFAHLCVDMQVMFAGDTPWATPWLERVLPNVDALAERFRDETIFTRFLPAQSVSAAPGRWQSYYERWPEMTGERLPAEMLDVVPLLSRHSPPARIFDKHTYSPWIDGRLDRGLRARNVTTLLVSGGETDICVLATVLGAVDLGYRVIIALDALFGSADETHDAVVTVFRTRLAQQIGICTTADAVDHIAELLD